VKETLIEVEDPVVADEVGADGVDSCEPLRVTAIE
jgi:hypothetical protein